MTTIELYKELKGDYDETREQPEKFIQTLQFAEEDNIKLLKDKEIKLKPKDWLILSIEPEILKKSVLRAEELGFLDAYKQNPSFLKQDVDVIIKRMSELEHLGIPYKNEKGAYLSFLFSSRAYAYVITENTKQSNHTEEVTDSPKDIELKDLADRVMETFALTNEREDVYQRLMQLENEGLGIKETLMELFKKYTDNLDYLSTSIDEILNSYGKVQMGR